MPISIPSPTPPREGGRNRSESVAGYARNWWPDNFGISGRNGPEYPNVSNREIARKLGVSEGTVRYQLRRHREGAVDGRSNQKPVAQDYRPAIDAYLASMGEESPSNVADLHDHLVAEHDYPASLRSLQRFVKRVYPQPATRARRRVETPPGAQAQADWAHFPRVWIGGRQVDLVAFSCQRWLDR